MDVKEAGSLGGQTTLKRKGKQFFKEISKIAAEARKRKKKENTIRPWHYQSLGVYFLTWRRIEL